MKARRDSRARAVDRGPSARSFKSLGALCTRFLSRFGSAQGGELCLLDVSRELGVERRRVYDIFNVFESVGIVRRKWKGKYEWIGRKGFLAALEAMRAQAAKERLEHAVSPTGPGRSGDKRSSGRSPLSSLSTLTVNSKTPPETTPEGRREARESNTATPATLDASALSGRSVPSPGSPVRKLDLEQGISPDKLKQEPFTMLVVATLEENQAKTPPPPQSRKEKSLGALSKQFVRVFVMNEGHAFSLESAARALGPGDESPSKLKGRVRRLYDIANVLVGMGLLRKTNATANSVKRPLFTWGAYDTEYLTRLCFPLTHGDTPDAEESKEEEEEASPQSVSEEVSLAAAPGAPLNASPPELAAKPPARASAVAVPPIAGNPGVFRPKAEFATPASIPGVRSLPGTPVTPLPMSGLSPIRTGVSATVGTRLPAVAPLDSPADATVAVTAAATATAAALSPTKTEPAPAALPHRSPRVEPPIDAVSPLKATLLTSSLPAEDENVNPLSKANVRESPRPPSRANSPRHPLTPIHMMSALGGSPPSGQQREAAKSPLFAVALQNQPLRFRQRRSGEQSPRFVFSAEAKAGRKRSPPAALAASQPSDSKRQRVEGSQLETSPAAVVTAGGR